MGQIKQKKAGLILLLITAVFTLPVFFAWFLYKNHDQIHTNTSNHGYLIEPPFQLTHLQINTATSSGFNPLKVEDEQSTLNQVLTRKWLVFTLIPSQCRDACQQSLYQIRQIRLATNADQNRVITAVLSLNKPTPHSKLNQLLKAEYPNTYNLSTNGPLFEKIVRRHIDKDYALMEGAIYIADPLCNVILVYAPNTDPELIYKDLHHLLQVSQIG